MPCNTRYRRTLAWTISLIVGCYSAPSHHDELDRRRSVLERDFRAAERLLLRKGKNSDEATVDSVVGLLRKIDRDDQADALAEFSALYFAGSDIHRPPTNPTRSECKERQRGADLIRQWANFGHMNSRGGFRIGTVAATYEVGIDGEVHVREVLRARHPAAAWLIIDAIGGARVSQSRLRRYQESEPESFPFVICAWWNYDEMSDRIPAGGRIRGLR